MPRRRVRGGDARDAGRRRPPSAARPPRRCRQARSGATSAGGGRASGTSPAPPDRVEGVERDDRPTSHRPSRAPRGRSMHVGTPGRGDLGDRRVVGRADDAMRAAGERRGRGPRGPDGPADERDAADRAQVLAGHPPAAAARRDQEQDRAVHRIQASRSSAIRSLADPARSAAPGTPARASGRIASRGGRSSAAMRSPPSGPGCATPAST